MEDLRLINCLRDAIEEVLENRGGREIVLFPFGRGGMQVKWMLNECYNVKESFIVDSHYAKFNSNFKSLDFLKTIESSQYIVLYTCTTQNLYKLLCSYFPEESICPVYKNKDSYTLFNTKCGKYSYGPLCDHSFVESVGAFTSIADGCDVVANHAMNYISTHMNFHYDDSLSEDMDSYDDRSWVKWYFGGVKPQGTILGHKKIKIGNDVWLGRNVIITNYSDIGNGVIAGAGSIITKPVPDYAVVVGAPARIIRYRYKTEQIEALNKIQWWNWSDDKIREFYADFYEDIDVFIQKHIND